MYPDSALSAVQLAIMAVVVTAALAEPQPGRRPRRTVAGDHVTAR